MGNHRHTQKCLKKRAVAIRGIETSLFGDSLCTVAQVDRTLFLFHIPLADHLAILSQSVILMDSLPLRTRMTIFAKGKCLNEALYMNSRILYVRYKDHLTILTLRIEFSRHLLRAISISIHTYRTISMWTQ